MLHVYDTNDDDNNNEYANTNTRKNRLDCNGILVTSEDLNGPFQNSSPAGSRTIYIKPLPNENDMSNSNLLTEKKRLPKAQHSALLPFPNDTDNVNTLTSSAGFSPKSSTQNTNKTSAKLADVNNYYALISPTHCISSNHNSSYSPTTNINYDHVNDNRGGEYNNTSTIIIPTSNYERQNSQPEQRQHRHQHHRHVNRSSFNRHSVLRRSLGGAVTIFSYPNPVNQHSSDSDVSHKSYTNNKDNVINSNINNTSSSKKSNNSHLIDHFSSQSSSPSLSLSVNARNDETINSYNDSVLYQRHIFCLSNLPVFDDLGFTLKPFPSNRSKFRGFRLLIDKSAHSEHFSRTDDIPLRSGDIIVTVNRNKLSNMSETEALQYVLNAFKDAQQYTIEVGIRRPAISLSSPLSKNSCITESSSPSSTLLPKKLFNRQKSDSGYSASIGMNASSNPHQPRRRCTEYVSGEFNSEQQSLFNKEEKNVDNAPIPNTRSSNLHRLSLMDYPDSPRLCSSSQFPFGDNSNPVGTDSGCSAAGGGYFDSINTAMLASSLSTNLTDNGFVTIRRPKHPGNLTTIDSNDRYSMISGSESPHHSSLGKVKKSSVAKIPLKNQNNDNNISNPGDNSNSRTLTPNTEGSTVSPGMPRKSLNVSNKDPNAFNTRTIGQTMHIQLTKMLNNGLGFTLTSRDTQTQSSQISDLVYVKKILPNGAAIQDGRLMIGDRLLAVDGQEVQSLNQVLLQLRSLEPGEQVDLLISRHITTTSGNDTDVNTTRKSSLPPHPFISLTYEYKLPLANSNQSDKHSSPALGINFKWSNDIPYISSTASSSSSPSAKSPNVQYSPVPGLYIDSLLPESIITSGNRITVQPGDRLVGINGESVDGMNAKNIVIRLKKILNQCHEQSAHSSGQSSSTFSLTVHRYKQDDSHRSGKAETLRPTTLPPRRNKSSHPEEMENNRQKPQDGCYSPLSFTLSDNRRRVLNRSDSMSSGIGSRSTHHRTEQRSSFRIPQLLNDNDEDSSQLPLPFSSSASSPVTNYPSSRNLSVPSNRNFMREGFGRRSVSEKRHGHVDASQYSFFQTNILPNRYKMPEDVDKQYSTMPTTRRLKMHKARLAAAAAAAANSHTPTSTTTTTTFAGGNGNQLTGTIGSGTGPLKALHSLSAIPPQSPVYTSYQDPDTVDIEHQSDQPPILRNRKQNNSFRHAVDRSFIPPTTTTTTTTTTGDDNFSSINNNNYANTLNMRSIYHPHSESPNVNPPPSSSSPPPPPLPPHRPRSGSANRDKLNPNIDHNNENKIKHTSPLAQPSSRSSSITTHKSTRPRSKSRSEGVGAEAGGSHTQPVNLIQPSAALQSSSMNSQVSSEQKQTSNNNSNNKSGLSALKNIFKIGTSKTVSEVNDSSASVVKTTANHHHHHSKTSETASNHHLLLPKSKKQQLRRSSVPENQLSVNQSSLTPQPPSKLTTEIHTTTATTTINAISSSNNSNNNNYINPNSLPMNKVAHPYIPSGHYYSNSPKSAVHLNSHTVNTDSPLRKVISPRIMMNSSHNSSAYNNNNNTVHVNPYCPPPDINPPPLPPRVSYTTPAMITTHHSKPVKYRPLPEPPENPPPPPPPPTTTVSVSKQGKQGTRRKSLANSISAPNTSVNVINQSTTTTQQQQQ
ncbi:unnamed protein product [Trichobilharzia szidati]|nr:unnamed protein product [Trichobilharzia szidati]CAH8857474.1 unnamed protein product [Trichobilharzia szidati]